MAIFVPAESLPSPATLPSYINQYRSILTQYHQVSTSPTYTVVAWGLQTSAQFTPGLLFLLNRQKTISQDENSTNAPEWSRSTAAAPSACSKEASMAAASKESNQKGL